MSSREINFESNENDVQNRKDDLMPDAPVIKVKPTIKVPAPVTGNPAEDVIRAAMRAEEDFRMAADNAGNTVVDGVASFDTLRVKKPTGMDFSSMTEEDVFNLDIPMEARPFSSEDSLKVALMDSGYVPRWVNKDPRRLGGMIAKGFTYVTEKDLRQRLEIEVAADAEGHFCLGDVILMKIAKERYYPAMRAAHLRAVATVGAKGAHKAALNNINEYMSKETHGAYREEAEAGKVAFYTPGVTI